MKLLQINYSAVLIAAIATFVLGAVWYTSLSAPWMAAAGLTEKEIMLRGGGGSAYIVSFVSYFLAAYAMAVLFKSMGVSTLKAGALMGAMIGAFLIGSNIFTTNSYELKPINLSFINAGFSVLSSAAQGAILGAWKKYAE